MAAERSGAWWRRVLPILMVAAATLVALAAVSEGAARLLFRQSASSTMACLIATDPRTGVHARPNTICQQKIFESGLVDYRFNDCGFRTPQPCRPAPPGTYRIMLIGSSVTYGMHVAQDDSFAGRLGPMLSARLHAPVDIFNEAMQWGTPASLALRTQPMLRPHPNMVLWALTPTDIDNARFVLPFISGVQPAFAVASSRTPAAVAPASVHDVWNLPARAWLRLIGQLSDTRSVFMLQHILYGSDSQYLSHVMAQGGPADYLRSPPSAALRDNLVDFSREFDRVAADMRAAKVPVVVTLLPSRPQVIMLVDHHRDKGYDPDQLGRLLRPIVESRGARYLDMTNGLASHPDAGRLFFPVDEHLPPDGHRMLASLLADALLRSGALPSGRAR